MKSPADMLASDVRQMARVIPAGWRAAALMMLALIFFPVLISVLILDALTEDMPSVRAPVGKALHRLGSWLHCGSAHPLPHARGATAHAVFQ
jgi:hypothetical protein